MMKTVIKRCFNVLASMNLAILILSVISILIMLQITSEKLIVSLESWKWLKAIATVDIYHSYTFVIILALFCINLLACCLKRLKVHKNALIGHNESEIASSPFFARIMIKDLMESTEKLSSLVATHFNKPSRTDKENNQLSVYAEKGRYSQFAFYLAHLSILTIVLGIMLSTRGYQYSFEMKKNQLLDPVIISDNVGKKKALGFSLLCESIETIYYQDRSTVKKHRSILTILRNGEKIKTQAVDFADSLNYDSVSIHQDLNSRTIKYATIKVVSKDGKSKNREVELGGWFKIKELGVSIIATLSEAESVLLRIASYPKKNTALTSESICVTNNPASFLDNRLKGYQFSLIDIIDQEAVRLRIVSDPGRKLIWYASFSMLLGFSIMFFAPHRQIWLRSYQEGGRSYVMVAGASTKNLSSFEQTFNSIVRNLKESFCEPV